MDRKRHAQGGLGGLCTYGQVSQMGRTTTLHVVDGKIPACWQDLNLYGFLLQLGLVPTFRELIERAENKQT